MAGSALVTHCRAEKRPIEPRHIDTRTIRYGVKTRNGMMPVGNGQVASAAPFRYQHMKLLAAD